MNNALGNSILDTLQSVTMILIIVTLILIGTAVWRLIKAVHHLNVARLIENDAAVLLEANRKIEP